LSTLVLVGIYCFGYILSLILLEIFNHKTTIQCLPVNDAGADFSEALGLGIFAALWPLALGSLTLGLLLIPPVLLCFGGYKLFSFMRN
jgi:hypothetical protein